MAYSNLAYLDYDAIRYGQLDELRITGYNHGLIAAENVTFTWRRYWENCEFIFSLPTSEVSDDGMVTMDLGDLPANSSVVISMQINLLYDIPKDTVVTGLSDISYITPLPDDPIWLVSPYYIFVPYSDPINGKFLVQLNPEDGRIDFIYFYGNATRITYIYNGTDVVDKIVTENETEPNMRRLSITSHSIHHHRRLWCLDVAQGAGAALFAALPVGVGISQQLAQGILIIYN